MFRKHFFFDYACNAWYPNANKKLKTRLQAAQNTCIRFCLKLSDRSCIKPKDVERINWFPIPERMLQCSLCSVYKFFSNNCPDYFDEIYFPVETRGVQTRSAHQKLKGALKVPHRKTNIGQKASYHIGPSL